MKTTKRKIYTSIATASLLCSISNNAYSGTYELKHGKSYLAAPYFLDYRWTPEAGNIDWKRYQNTATYTMDEKWVRKILNNDMNILEWVWLYQEVLVIVHVSDPRSSSKRFGEDDNGWLRMVAGMVEMDKGTLTIYSNHYLLTPLIYLNPKYSTQIFLHDDVKDSNYPPVMTILDMEAIRDNGKYVKGLTELRYKSWRDETKILLDGGMLVMALNAAKDGQLHSRRGDLYLAYISHSKFQEGPIKLDSRDHIGELDVTNIANQFDIFGGNEKDYIKYGKLNVYDAPGVGELVGTGTTTIKGFVDWQSNELVQSVLKIENNAGLKTQDIGKIRADSIENFGKLTLTSLDGGSFTNTSPIVNDSLNNTGHLVIEMNGSNTAPISQNTLSISSGVKFTSYKNTLLPLISRMNIVNLINDGVIELKDGYGMNIIDDGAGIVSSVDLGKIILNNGSYLDVKNRDFVRGEIKAIGSDMSKLSLENSSGVISYEGLIQVGDSSSGETGKLQIAGINSDNTLFDISKGSVLDISTNSQVTLLNAKTLLGKITMSSISATLNYYISRDILGGFSAEEGNLNIGSNEHNAILSLRQSDSYIGSGVKLNLHANSVLNIANDKASVVLGDHTLLNGTVNLQAGNLELQAGVHANNKLITSGGSFKLDAGSSLSTADGSMIGKNTFVTIEDGIVNPNAKLVVSGGSVMLNGVGSSGKLKADILKGDIELDSGKLYLSDKATFVSQLGGSKYSQSGGSLVLDGSSLQMRATSTKISSGDVLLKNSSSLLIDNVDSGNSFKLLTDGSTRNSLTIGSAGGFGSTITLQSGSLFLAPSALNLENESKIVLLDNVKFQVSTDSNWNGRIESQSRSSSVDIIGSNVKDGGGILQIKGGRLSVMGDAYFSSTDILGGSGLGEEIRLTLLKDSTTTFTSEVNIYATLQNYVTMKGVNNNLFLFGNSTNELGAKIEQKEIHVQTGNFEVKGNASNSVVAEKLIVQRFGSMSANANSISTGEFKNYGTFEIKGGVVDYEIIDDLNPATISGKLIISDNTTFNANIRQSELAVNKNLNINSGKNIEILTKTTNSATLKNDGILTTTLSNSGKILGLGEMYLSKSSTNEQNATINQKSITLNDGLFDNKNSTQNSIVVADTLLIKNGAEFATNVNAFDGKVINEGTLTSKGGIIDFEIGNLDGSSHKGVLNIAEDTILQDGFALRNNVKVQKEKEFYVENMSNIDNDKISNSGVLRIKSGDIASNILIENLSSTNGKVVIDSNNRQTITNNGVINQHVDILVNNFFNSSIDGLGSSIKNDGTLSLSGSLIGTGIKTTNTITGVGTLDITDSMSNNASIVQDIVNISNGNTLVNEATIVANKNLAFEGELRNNGKVSAVLNNTGNITSDLVGKVALLEITGNSTNSGNITQNRVLVNAHTSLTNTGSVTSSFEIKGNVLGGGTLTNVGTSQINANVQNNIINASGNTINVHKGSLSGGILNDGVINFKNTHSNTITLNSEIDTILSTGTINIDSTGRVVLNGEMKNQNITISKGTLELGDRANLNSSSLTITASGNWTGTGGIVDLSSSAPSTQNIYLKNFTVNTNNTSSGLFFDVDLKNLSSDKFIISGLAKTNYALNLMGINLLSDFATDGTKTAVVKLFDTQAGGVIESNFEIGTTKIASDSGVYEVSQVALGSGDIKIEKVANGMSLKEAIEDSSISSFSMTQDYKGPLSDLAGLLLNRTFTLYGNDHVIDGNSGRGLLVQSDASDTWHQTLHVKNATFQNFKFNTNEPDFYALVNQSKTILNGVHFKNNYDKNGNLVDIANSGTLVFEGAESTLTGSIIAGGPGRGDIHILGTNLDMSHGVIEQKDIFIDDFGSLYVDADNLKLTGSVSNDGMVALGSGKLTADISGDGFTRILGDVQNSFDRTINQDIHVVEDGVFTTDILYAKKEFANYGVLNLTGSVISDKNLIYGDGTLNIDSTMSNNAKTISQSNINIAQNTTFTNSNTSQIYATELLRNKGAIDNSGIIDAILDNQGSIGGDGELNVYGISVNSGAIDVGSLNLKNALFTNANANADVLKAVNDINIDELSTLITNATAVGSKVQNSGILGLIGGTLNKEVSGDGVVQIAGDVTSNAKIEQTGVNVQEGTLSNENTIIATVVVQEKGTLNSKIENITGTIFNDGVFNIDGAIILNEIIGDGVLNVKNNLVNSSYIKQNIINIGSAYSFNSNASDINSKVKNDGVYNIDGGVVLGAVSGSGVVNIEDDTLFNAIVAQSQINIKEHNTLISNASFVKGLVENASVLYLTGGTLTSAVQGDNGLLYITDERVTNNANIDQDAIYVVSSLTNNSNISANLVQNEGEINNGGYIFSNLYNAKQIIGNGTYGLKGYSQNLANASFTQKLIELNEAVFDNNGTVRADLLSVDGSSILISNASNINSKVRNDGLYNVLGGTIGQDIYKSASSENSILDILGEVRNSANVSQNYIEIDGAGRLINDGVMSADVLFENDGVFINNKTLTASALINENLITNDGVIAGSLNNVGVINGTGAFNLLGTSLNNGMLSQDNITLANAILINENTIKAKSVHVDSLSTLQSIADEVQSKVSNDGIYQVLGGSIGWDVLGVGQMNILENSTNIANITQKYIYVASEKTLTNSTGSITADLIHVDSDITSASSLNPAVLHVHNASNVNSAVLNDGIYRVVNGEIKKDVGGVGELYIISNVQNSANIDQELVSIEDNATLTNSQNASIETDLLVNKNSLVNDGYVLAHVQNGVGSAITGEGLLVLSGHIDESGSVTTTTTNSGLIKQKYILLLDDGHKDSSNVRVYSTLQNNGRIFADETSISDFTVLNSNASNMQSKIINDGTYNVLGGVIDYDIGGTGTMYFKANTTNNANIIQDHIDVNSGVTLVNEGDILISESSKKLAIASMSVGEYVSDHSTGETIFSQMKNDGLAVHSIINNGAIVNNGTLEGSLENNGNVTGEGSLYLHGNSINASNTTIKQTSINLAYLSKLTNNNDDYKSLDAGVINISNGAKLVSNAFAVGGVVQNDGTYQITSTNSPINPNVINYNIVHTDDTSGTLQIVLNNDEKVVNDAIIKQGVLKIENGELYNNTRAKISSQILISDAHESDSGGVLTSNASNIVSDITNNGVYNVLGGVISNSVVGTKNYTEFGASEITSFYNYFEGDGSHVKYAKSTTDTNTHEIKYDISPDGNSWENNVKVTTVSEVNDEVTHLNTYADGILKDGIKYTKSVFNSTSQTELYYISTDGTNWSEVEELPEDFTSQMYSMTLNDGILNVKNSASNDGLIQQKEVNIASRYSFENSGYIDATELNNKGKLQNSFKIMAKLTNDGVISGDGELYLLNGSVSKDDISNHITLDNNATLTILEDALISGDILMNEGSTLIVHGDTFGVDFKGKVQSISEIVPTTIKITGDHNTNNARFYNNISNQNIEVENSELHLINSPLLTNVNLALNENARLSTLDGKKSHITLNSLSGTYTTTPTLSFDVGDIFTINNALLAGSGSVNLGNISLNTTADYSSGVQIFDSKSIILQGDGKVYSSTSKYTVSQNISNPQFLDVHVQNISNGLSVAVDELSSGVHTASTYMVASEDKQGLDLGTLSSGNTLMIAGDLHAYDYNSLKGSGVEGLKIETNSALHVQNLHEVSGFSSSLDGGFASSHGTLHVGSTAGIRTVFSNNYAKEYGGGVLNSSQNSLYGSNVNFKNNIVSIGGGAIANFAGRNGGVENARTELNDVVFEGNRAGFNSSGGADSTNDGFGGAVFNSSTIDGKSGVAYLTDTSYISNSATSQGGAIYNSALGTTNSYAILNVNDSVFTSNSAIGEGASGEGFGGAIYNGANGVIYSEDTLYPSTIIDHLDIHAGVLPTELTAGSLSINSSLFQNNTAFTSGGAIYNAGSGGVELIDVDLIGNSAINGVGGAVYTAGNNISVLADVKDVQIYGNSANGKSNAIYVGGTGSALIGLGANASRVLSLNDTIMTNSFDTTFQINENAQVGTIVFGEEFGVLKADGSFGASSYVLNAGEVKIANSDKFSHISALSSLNLSTHTTINTINNSIQDLTLENFSVQGVTPVVNLALDMGYDEVDTISATSVTIPDDTTFKIVDVSITPVPDGVKDSVAQLETYGDKVTYRLVDELNGYVFRGKIFDRRLSLNSNTLFLNSVGFNPSVLASSVATSAGAFLTQTTIYEQSFTDMDNLMNSKERDFISESLRDDEKGKIWVKPFAVSEKVDLKNFGKVDNKLYGTLVGMDLGIASFDNGVDMTYSAFTGYSLSKQNYDEVAIRQNGGVLGANVAFYKGNFFAGVSANIGLNDVKADTMYGSEKFTILTGGVASKVGYNFDIEDSFVIIQPSFTTSYTYIKAKDYTNASGVAISSKPIHALQFIPSVKISAELESGYQPYFNMQMVISVADKTKFNALDIALPEMSVKPYGEYKVGVNKNFTNNFNAYAQTALRSGGRSGASVSFGFKWKY